VPTLQSSKFHLSRSHASICSDHFRIFFLICNLCSFVVAIVASKVRIVCQREININGGDQARFVNAIQVELWREEGVRRSEYS
jgi:hypothetical protein